MNELIKIESRNGIETVNARELYEFLESKQEFANWIKGRIEKFEFSEGNDFTVDKFINGRATQIDYYISIDMAKELSMVENNTQGRQARKYFIECEKQLKNNQINIQSIISETIKQTIPALTEMMTNMISENNKSIFETIKHISGNQTLQIEQTKQQTVKEYIIEHNIKTYNINNFLIRVGRLCTKVSRELCRSINYKPDGNYSVGCYDTDIIKHSVTIINLEDQKQKDLFYDS